MSTNLPSTDRPQSSSPILDIHNPTIPLPTGAIFNFRPVRWLRKDMSAPMPENSSTPS